MSVRYFILLLVMNGGPAVGQSDSAVGQFAANPASARHLPDGEYTVLEVGGRSGNKWEPTNPGGENSRRGRASRSPPFSVDPAMLKQTNRSEDAVFPEGDKPRKKLSFREPEILGYYMQMKENASRWSWRGRAPKKKDSKAGQSRDDIDVGRKNAAERVDRSAPSSPSKCLNCEKRQLQETLLEDEDELESQAMRVVRTVGQAFDVCHKLSINSPDDDKPSEKDSTLDRKKKDNYLDSSRLSDPGRGADTNSSLDISGRTGSPDTERPLRLELMSLPTPNSPRKSPLGIAGETYSSPMLESLDSGEPDTPRASIPSAGTPLGAHHELQLLREQLEQQTQQTQAAVAQVHLLRDQLAAETAARLEAQTRIHQLLVQNKELLDHIAALVQLLQEQERLQQGNQNVSAVPQQMMMGDVSGMYHLQPDMGGGGFLSAAPLPSALSSSYYNLFAGSMPPIIHPGSAEYLQRLRSLYYPQSRPGSQSFPGTPILPHRAPERPASANQEDAFIRPLNEEEPPKSDSHPDVRVMKSDLKTLRLQEQNVARPSYIQRSTSEKVPNRSELMSQVTRAAWARHTTK